MLFSRFLSRLVLLVSKDIYQDLNFQSKKFVVYCKNCGLHGGGGGIRTHEPLRDGITHDFYLVKGDYPHSSYLESCAFDQASLLLLSGYKRIVMRTLFHGYY